MKRLLLLLGLVAQLPADAGVLTLPGGFVQEHRSVPVQADGDAVVRKLDVYVTYGLTPGAIDIDVVGVDAVVTLTDVKLDGVALVAGSTACIVPVPPQTGFTGPGPSSPGLHSLQVQYDLLGVTGEWSVPVFIDAALQPLWSGFDTSAGVSAELRLWDQVAPISGWAVSGALFVALVYWTIRRLRETARSL
jgi:hypothetical protein